MITANHRRQVLFSLVFLWASTLSAWAEFQDVHTLRSGMHACRKPGFMTGLHINRNVLLCDDTVMSDEKFEAAEEEIDGLDTTTLQWGMHACPKEMAITGYHHQRNQLLCAKVGPTRDFLDANGWTQRNGMHACPVINTPGGPISTVMRGIHAARNDFICAEILRRPGQACSTNHIPRGVWDCDTQCVDADTAKAWQGDGICDDGDFGINLSCIFFGRDGGDCNNK